MVFNDKRNEFAFKLLIIIVLFGVSETILFLNYFDLPKINEDHNYIFGSEQYKNLVKVDFIWDIDFSDNQIGQIESILIYIPMLWGMMRLVDLMYFLVKYKKDDEVIF